MKIKLNKEIVENKDLSNQAILAYVALLACSKFDYEPIFINRNMMYYYLTGNVKQGRRLDESLKIGLSELIDNNIIDCVKQNATNYYFGFNNIKLKENDKFIFVNFEDIRKIMECSYQGKINLLRYYIVLLGTFICKNHIFDIREPDKYNNVLGMMSQEYISDLAGVSVHSAVEYTKILEKLKLIYVYRCSFMFKDFNGRIKRHNNIYGKYENKEIINEFSALKYEMYDDLHKEQREHVANNYRSLMQKYNCLIKGKEYDEKTIDSIFKYIIKYNNKHPGKEKDLNIFKSFGYVID